jgi:DNA-binding response OmpR family regulator
MRNHDGDLIQEAAIETTSSRVLLAEDDAETRALLAMKLRKEGYDVVELTNGRELLSRIRSSLLGNSGPAPELIITDIRMPGPNGLKVLAGLRQSSWSTPVILMTAFGDAETHAEARRLGAYAVFDKPFDLDEFCAAVIDAAGPPMSIGGATKPKHPGPC